MAIGVMSYSSPQTLEEPIKLTMWDSLTNNYFKELA